MADQKVSALTELTTFSGDETFYVVEDDDGTPVSRRVTIENLKKGLFVDTEGSMYGGIDNRYRFAEEFGADEGYDEEFDGANIADDTFPTGWSDLSMEAAAVYRQSFGSGRIDWGGGGDITNIQAVGRTLPATATFDAICHLVGMNDVDISYQAVMILHNSANGDYIHFGMFQPDTTPPAANPETSRVPAFYVVHYTDADTSSSTLAGPIILYPSVGPHCYYRINKASDSSYQFQIAPDGACWFNVGAALNINTTLGADPTHIGFGFNGSGAGHVACEWMRIRNVA